MTPDEWYGGLCQRMGWPPTAWRKAVMAFWAQQEGMPFAQTFNPFATTYHGAGVTDSPQDIGFGPGRWNKVGVGIYASPSDGVEATALTLSLSYYANIRKAFADQTGYPSIVGPQDFTTWVGNNVYGQRILDFMLTCTADRGYAAATPATTDPALTKRLDDLTLALFAGKEQPGDRAARLAYANSRVADVAGGNAVSLVEIAGSALAARFGASRDEIIGVLQNLITALKGGAP